MAESKFFLPGSALSVGRHNLKVRFGCIRNSLHLGPTHVATQISKCLHSEINLGRNRLLLYSHSRLSGLFQDHGRFPTNHFKETILPGMSCVCVEGRYPLTTLLSKCLSSPSRGRKGGFTVVLSVISICVEETTTYSVVTGGHTLCGR